MNGKSALFAGLMAFAAPVFAAVYPVASLVNPLDNVGPNARAIGMGSAFVGVADDASSLLWNPAGLGGLKNTELQWDSNALLGGVYQETALAAIPLGPGTLGASVNYVNYGTLSNYDDNGTFLGNYTANEYGFAVGWGQELLADIAGGVTIKGSTQTIDNATDADLAADLGLLWHPFDGFRVGLACTNLGTPVAGYAEASALRGGLSYCLSFDGTNRLLLAASGAWEPLGVNSVQMGAEDRIFQLLALRIGYQADLASTQIQGLYGLTAGIGICVKGFDFDYAYLPFGDLGSTNWITLGYKFG